MRHWPEQLLALMFLLGGILPQMAYRGGSLLVRVLLSPIGCLAALGLWVTVIAVYCTVWDWKEKRRP